MRTLIWKELRENVKWALLALVILTLAELDALYPSANEEFNLSSFDGITLTRPTFLSVTTFGCAATGFILGLIQIVPELKRDRWAGLLHRPVTRGRIFLGKAVTGLFLYAFASATPFLLMVWLAATPGHFAAPFVPGLTLAGTADIIAGASYYLAALGMALQRGGWIGLRVLPLLAALFTSFYIQDQHLFYVAAEAAVAMAVALFIAAWGAMHDQDQVRRRPWLARVAFLAIVFYGVCGGTELVMRFVGTLFPRVDTPFQRYEMADDGVPLHVYYGKGDVIVAVKNLDGTPVTDPRYQPDSFRRHMMYANWFSQVVGASHGWHERRYEEGYRSARTYMWADNAYFMPRREQWFTLVQENYMIGFLPVQKVAFSVLDRRGFHAPTETPMGFDHDVHFEGDAPNYFVWSPDQARFARLDRREIVDLPLPAPGPIYGMGSAFARTKQGDSVSAYGLTLGSGIALFDDDAHFITTLPYHHDMDRWGWLSLGINGTLDRFYLQYDPSAWINGKVRKTMPSFVEEMNARGQVIHSYTLPPLPDTPNPRSWTSFLASRMRSPASYFGIMVYKEIGALLGSTRMHDDLQKQLGDRKELEQISATVLVLALISGIVAFQLARRAYFPTRRARAWTLFVFAFGLPGLLTFLLAADWPVRVTCPSCGRKRPTDSEHCPACGAAWPAPPASGIEIFEPAETVEGARA